MSDTSTTIFNTPTTALPTPAYHTNLISPYTYTPNQTPPANNLIILYGPEACGKTRLLNLLTATNDLKPLLYYTNRTRQINERSHKDAIFTKSPTLIPSMYSRGEVLFYYTQLNPKGALDQYGFNPSDCGLLPGNTGVVEVHEELPDLLNYFTMEHICLFYIYTPTEERMRRARRRTLYDRTEWEDRREYESIIYSPRRLHSIQAIPVDNSAHDTSVLPNLAEQIAYQAMIKFRYGKPYDRTVRYSITNRCLYNEFTRFSLYPEDPYKTLPDEPSRFAKWKRDTE